MEFQCEAPARRAVRRFLLRDGEFRPNFVAIVAWAALCLTVFSGCNTSPLPLDAFAKKGQIDLRGLDLREKVVNLSGEYEFYWRKFLTPAGNSQVDLTSGETPDAFVAVPGAWNDLRIPEDSEQTIGGEGYATYRLRVLWNPIHGAGLRIPTMHTAYRLYLNGAEVSSNGRPGISRESSRAGYNPRIVEIPPQSSSLAASETVTGTPQVLELILHISNFQHRKGGTWTNIQIASLEVLRERRELALLFDFFLFGSLLIMGVYHVGLFLMRPAGWSPLYFGIFCLLVTLRILTTGEHYLLHLWPGFDWEWYIKIQYWTVYLALPAFASFAYHAFPREFPRWVLAFTYFVAGIASLFILFTPVRIFSWSMAAYQVLFALAGVVMLMVLMVSLWRGRAGARLYMIGWIFLFTTVINDILNTAEVIQTGYSVPFGFFLFISMQAIFLALQFSKAYETAERMSETLEDRIQERTRELEDSRDQLRAAKNLAERSDRAKSEFLATMSHEIRTPLNSILGTASLLEESPLSGEQKQQVSILNRAGKRLLTLINEVLDLSKIEAGKLSLESMPFRIHDVCADLQGLMGNRAELKGISLQTEYAPGVPDRCVGDANRLAQVLLNLVGNAIKFTETGGVILKVEQATAVDESPSTVAPEATGMFLRFSVIDSGIGISPDKQRRIFESFVQADQSDDRRYEGTGLGLAISRRLVELMGGQLKVRSQPEQGSVFWFDVWFALDVSSTGEVEPVGVGGSNGDSSANKIQSQAVDAQGSAHDTRRVKILLADDNPDNRYLVQVFLKKTMAELQSVENGQEALERAQSETFDLILMDIQMPVMNGYEAVRAIRLHEKINNADSTTKILALTADATREAYHKAMAAGCDGYLTKPIQKQALIEAIEEYIK